MLKAIWLAACLGLALALTGLAGCGSGGGDGGGPGNSPFVGNWTGTWTDTSSESGTLDITFDTNGNVSAGAFSGPGSSSGIVTGTIDNSGNINITLRFLVGSTTETFVGATTTHTSTSISGTVAEFLNATRRGSVTLTLNKS